MMSYLNILPVFLSIFLLSNGCTTASNVPKSETVTLILNDGEKIDAQVLTINGEEVRFKARNIKKAYTYGEVLPRQRIERVRLRDGTEMSLREYESHRRGESKKTSDVTENRKQPETPARYIDANSQYEALKYKPISEMTENEFEFYMMMKQRELESREQRLAAVLATNRAGIEPATALDLDKRSASAVPQKEAAVSSGLVNSIIESGLAPGYLAYLRQKETSGIGLSVAERDFKMTLLGNKEWLDKIEDLQYIAGVAEKSLARAFLHNPSALKALNLTFDADHDMDFADLMRQIHQLYGPVIEMGELRSLLDVLGEDGAKAVKEIIDNFASYEFQLADKSMTAK